MSSSFCYTLIYTDFAYLFVRFVLFHIQLPTEICIGCHLLSHPHAIWGNSFIIGFPVFLPFLPVLVCLMYLPGYQHVLPEWNIFRSVCNWRFSLDLLNFYLMCSVAEWQNYIFDEIGQGSGENLFAEGLYYWKMESNLHYNHNGFAKRQRRREEQKPCNRQN